LLFILEERARLLADHFLGFLHNRGGDRKGGTDLTPKQRCKSFPEKICGQLNAFNNLAPPLLAKSINIKNSAQNRGEGYQRKAAANGHCPSLFCPDKIDQRSARCNAAATASPLSA